jgi:LemA protein
MLRELCCGLGEMHVTALTIVALVVVAVIVYAVSVYNRLVTKKNQVSEAWSDIDVQTKRRYDLIPNIVETVKGYAAHEQNTLEKVIAARNAAIVDKTDLARTAQSEGALQGALKSLFALSESYPDLKANQNFQSLQTELSTIEEAIQRARRYY